MKINTCPNAPPPPLSTSSSKINLPPNSVGQTVGLLIRAVVPGGHHQLGAPNLLKHLDNRFRNS